MALTSFCRSLNGCIDNLAVNFIVIAITAFNLFVTTALVLIEYKLLQDPGNTFLCNNATHLTEWRHREDRIDIARFVLHITELVVLSAFTLEIVSRLLLYNVTILHKKWEAFDAFVVIATFVTYVTMTTATEHLTTIAYPLSYLTVLRFWRCGQIYAVVRDAVEKSKVAEETIIQLEQELLDAKARLCIRLGQEYYHSSSEKLFQIEGQHKSIGDLKLRMRSAPARSDVTPRAVVIHEMQRQMLQYEDKSESRVPQQLARKRGHSGTPPQGPKYARSKSRTSAATADDTSVHQTAPPAAPSRRHHEHSRQHGEPVSESDQSNNNNNATDLSHYHSAEVVYVSSGKDISVISGSGSSRKQQRVQQTSVKAGSGSDVRRISALAVSVGIGGSRNLVTSSLPDVESVCRAETDVTSPSVGRHSMTDSDDGGDGSRVIVETGSDGSDGGSCDQDKEETETSGTTTSEDDAVGDSWASDRHSQSPLKGIDTIDTGGCVLIGYSNEGFLGDVYTDEQLREIDRIARVPFTPYQPASEDETAVPVTTL